MVGVAFLGSGIGSGVAIWGASVFILPMTEELGWTRATFFIAFTVRSVIVGLASPVIGPWLDTRNGPRFLAVTGAVVLTVSMVALSRVEHLWQFILLYGVCGAYAELAGGFALANVLIPKWFVRRRGRALGISIMGVGLGALVFPGAVSGLVAQVGWRDAWIWFGLTVGIITFLLSFLVRTRPEDIGLLPDGDAMPTPASNVSDGKDLLDPEPALTRYQALRTPAFWMLLISFSFVGFGITGFQANWLPFLLESDFSAAQASMLVAIYGFVSGVSRPIWGLVGEKISPRWLMAMSTIVTSGIIVLFLLVTSISGLSLLMAAGGLSMGGYLILRALLSANYFGRTHLGAVNSMIRPFGMGAGAVGPLLFGFLYDLEGNYVIPFLVASAAWGIAGFVVLLASPPKNHHLMNKPDDSD